jgi:hypothetical protein
MIIPGREDAVWVPALGMNGGMSFFERVSL